MPLRPTAFIAAQAAHSGGGFHAQPATPPQALAAQRAAQARGLSAPATRQRQGALFSLRLIASTLLFALLLWWLIAPRSAAALSQQQPLPHAGLSQQAEGPGAPPRFAREHLSQGFRQ